MDFKWCYKCKIEKPLGDFGRNNKSKDEHATICKICDVAKVSEYRLKNLAKVKEYHTKYNKENAERLREQRIKYRKSEAGKIAKLNRHYLAKSIFKETNVTKEFLKTLKAETTHCELCNCEMVENGKVYPNGKQLDHIVPINVGGTHWTTNLRYICYQCNVSRPKDVSDLGDRIVYVYQNTITV